LILHYFFYFSSITLTRLRYNTGMVDNSLLRIVVLLRNYSHNAFNQDVLCKSVSAFFTSAVSDGLWCLLLEVP